jgi:hypothetical protein
VKRRVFRAVTVIVCSTSRVCVLTEARTEEQEQIATYSKKNGYQIKNTTRRKYGNGTYSDMD